MRFVIIGALVGMVLVGAVSTGTHSSAVVPANLSCVSCQ